MSTPERILRENLTLAELENHPELLQHMIQELESWGNERERQAYNRIIVATRENAYDEAWNGREALDEVTRNTRR